MTPRRWALTAAGMAALEAPTVAQAIDAAGTAWVPILSAAGLDAIAASHATAKQAADEQGRRAA